MRKRHAMVGILASLGACLLLFQNMTLTEFNSLNIADVDDSMRVDQSRELLGIYYRNSWAKKLEGNPYLSYLIFKKVDEALKTKRKDQVPELVQTIIKESQEFEFDPVFIMAVIQTESSFNPKQVGSAGEIGLMQILPKTAEWIAKKNHLPWKGDKSLYDPSTNVRIGIRYFAMLREQFDGHAYHYLPAYNMGPKNMRKIDAKMGAYDKHGRVQKREYAMHVMKNYTAIYQELAASRVKIETLAKSEEVDPDQPVTQ
jgi:soluble lytic murein transglycosylase